MRYWMLISALVLMVSSLSGQEDLKQGDIVYVSAEFENIRVSPNGTVVTQLPQGTKIGVIGQQGNWVAVQFVGWVWRPSLTKNVESIKGYTMRALHIFVKSEEEALEIKKLLAGGRDFAELAKEKSKGPNAAKGGDLGVIQKGDLLPELDSALRKLKPGQVSDVLKSEMGYHIFKRLE